MPVFARKRLHGDSYRIHKLWNNFLLRRRWARPKWVGSTSTRHECVGLPKRCWCSPPHPTGSPPSQLAEQVRRMSQQDESQYGPRRASYDLKKLRGKQIVSRIGKTARYQTIPHGARAMAALVVLRDRAIKPLLAAIVQHRRTRRPHNPTPLDIHYQTIRESMRGVFKELGIAA